MRDIVRIGRAHLATDGAAALSLRAVARDLGIVSSAVYRYVANRDELLTLLVVDGYDELGDEVDAALAKVDPADHAGRMVAIGRAVRAWALAEPATYALLFGSPVPGMRATRPMFGASPAARSCRPVRTERWMPSDFIGGTGWVSQKTVQRGIMVMRKRSYRSSGRKSQPGWRSNTS